MTRWREDAPAKINLFLHVTGRRADGYHLLESLFVYLDLADRLEARVLPPGARDRLAVSGPTGAALADAGADNLVLQALRALRSRHPALPPLALRLEKNIPVAAGLGGGSADAAAALRLGARILQPLGDSVGEDELAQLAVTLGADVPPALRSRACLVAGIGEKLSPLAAAPALAGLVVLLVNPGEALATARVFRAFAESGRSFRAAVAGPPAAALGNPRALAHWLKAKTANDLEAAAAGLLPVVREVLDLLSATGALLARMSGSGATCFALFADAAAAAAAQKEIAAARPSWWTALARIRQSWQQDAAVGALSAPSGATA